MGEVGARKSLWRLWLWLEPPSAQSPRGPWSKRCYRVHTASVVGARSLYPDGGSHWEGLSLIVQKEEARQAPSSIPGRLLDPEE